MKPSRGLSVRQRFERLYIPEPMSGCFLWIGARQHTNGRLTRNMERYGYFTMSSRPKRFVYAHRFAWEQEHGPIPSTVHVLHRCDNPPCVNVDHLYLGTHASNMADMVVRKRQANGERNGWSKLTLEQARAIKRFGMFCPRDSAGRRIGVKAFAGVLGVCRTHLYDLFSGALWRSVQ
jgi:hypothetical protein